MKAETAVVQEAGASATIYLLTTGPDHEAVATRAALGNYLRLVIDRDWPLMATRKGKPRGDAGAQRALCRRLAPDGERIETASNFCGDAQAAWCASPRPAAPGFTRKPRDDAGAQRALCRRPAPDGERIETASNFCGDFQAARCDHPGPAAPGFALQPASSPGSYGWSLFMRRNTDRGIHVLFRHQEPTGAQVMMTGILSVIVFMGLLVIVLIEYPLHRSRSCRQRAATDRGRGIRARLDRIAPKFVHN